MFNPRSIKTQLIIYLAVVAAIIAAKENSFTLLMAILITVSAAVIIESLILYIRQKSFWITENSIITGIIIGYVLSGDEAWWKFVFAALLAISSKYLIVFKKRHIFNPAAFGIFFSILILGISTQWTGTYLWYILVPFGIYFAWKMRKSEILISYAIASLVLFGAQAILQKVPLFNIFGYFSYFYVFIMVIEPKTTPFKAMEKYIFGVGIAVLIFVLTGAGVRFDVELACLLFMNVIVLLLNKIQLNRGGAV